MCAENFDSIIYKGKPTELSFTYIREDIILMINRMKSFFGSCYYYELYDYTYNKVRHKQFIANRVHKLCMKAEYWESLSSVYVKSSNIWTLVYSNTFNQVYSNTLGIAVI